MARAHLTFAPAASLKTAAMNSALIASFVEFAGFSTKASWIFASSASVSIFTPFVGKSRIHPNLCGSLKFLASSLAL